MEHTLRIALIGDTRAGKTSLLRQFCEGGELAVPLDPPPPTTGVDFQTCRVMLTHGGQPIQAKLNIWDASGHPRYASIAAKFLPELHGALCVYDVTNPASLRAALAWFRTLRQASPGAACTLVGTKRDLRFSAAGAVVSRTEGEAVAERLRAAFSEVSVQEADSVTALFMRAAQASLERSLPPPPTAASSLLPQPPGQEEEEEDEAPSSRCSSLWCPVL
jgi:small GTP-binding protein